MYSRHLQALSNPALKGILHTFKPIGAHLFSTLGLIFASSPIPSRLHPFTTRISSLFALSHQLKGLQHCLCSALRRATHICPCFCWLAVKVLACFLAFRTCTRTAFQFRFVSDLIGWVCAALSSLPPHFQGRYTRTHTFLMIAPTIGNYLSPHSFIAHRSCISHLSSPRAGGTHTPASLAHIPSLPEFQHSLPHPLFTFAILVVLLLLMLWLPS